MRGQLIGKTKYRMKYCRVSTYIAEGLSKLENFTGVLFERRVRMGGGIKQHGKM